ncbi:alpha/beta fold hydrolase [Gordonia desulfuricans]|uniref:Alpha/beta fold hydrolase n=1 Tax=Gordonia desulfuricans TaxID=89051 RepID=A0A7K3LMS4_9ACTN|nr:alpha/beta fold hydrolase [Gordonia desulfuricans]NDK88827.1 alpha/beta fold hydrolase [Gordonia desulfuricans]
MKRSDVEFASSGVTCRAWLYRPDSPNPPVIVMAHGLGATRRMRLDAFAERFTAAGYACLVFDYRHFGDSGGRPRELLSIRRQLADWDAAITFTRTLPDVDTARIVIWGTSFGAGHALVIGARHPDLAAVIAQCPFTSGLASLRALDRAGAVKVTALGLADAGATLLRRPPVRVGLVGRAHDAALMTAADAESGYLRLVPDDAEFTNAVTARVALTLPLYHPVRSIRRLRVPTLICVCDRDTVAPAGPTITAAEASPMVTLNRYPDGHFDIYVDDGFERVVADQIAFLQRTVPV